MLDFFWRLGAGASLLPASEAGTFRTREAGGSPTSAEMGVTCSSTWGSWSAETGIKEKEKQKIK